MSDFQYAAALTNLCDDCGQCLRNENHIWCQQCYEKRLCGYCGRFNYNMLCQHCNGLSENATYDEITTWEAERNRPDDLTVAIRRSIIMNIPIKPVQNVNDTCAICLDDFTKENQGKFLSCGHYYHIVCCDTWLEEKMTCPQCQHTVKL